jgi:hypothetical protein
MLHAAQHALRCAPPPPHADARRRHHHHAPRPLPRRHRTAAAPPSRDEAEGSLTWRYEWEDEGAALAATLRDAFTANVRRGEAAMDVAEAALLVSAEDDALMSVTGVPLPVQPYLQRIERMADELSASALLPASASDDDVSSQAAVIAAVDDYVFVRQGFRPPAAPAIGARTAVDMPGVYEDPRHAYLNCVLTRKVGSPATLAVLYAALWRALLARRAVRFGVRLRLPRDACSAPSAVPLPAGALSRSGAFVNTWPATDALADMLRQLKRAYWPFRWDTALDAEEDGPCGSGGGFLAASRAALGTGEEDAMTTAVARTAAHRLARGVWTSSGAGDIRRARAAAERLVILLGDAAPRERCVIVIIAIFIIFPS